MMPLGLSASRASAEASQGSISQYTWHSRTRRVMSWLYCEP